MNVQTKSLQGPPRPVDDGAILTVVRPHNKPAEAVVLEIGSNATRGLPRAEAKRAVCRNSGYLWPRPRGGRRHRDADRSRQDRAGLLEAAEKEPAPLQQELDRTGKRLTVVMLGICAIVFAAGVLSAKALTLNVVLSMRSRRRIGEYRRLPLGISSTPLGRRPHASEITARQRRARSVRLSILSSASRRPSYDIDRGIAGGAPASRPQANRFRGPW